MQTRRQLLRAGAGAAATILAPQSLAVAASSPKGQASALLRGARFGQGVLSGEPTPRSITLLTVLDRVNARSGSVRLEIARDKDFRRVVARRTIATSRAANWSVKARVEGLRPYEQYYYRFETRDDTSPVGRFRTALPADSRQPVRFGFFSCADFTHGYFNAYELLSRLDLDFVVNLGDYIYAETYHTRRGGTAVREDPIGSDARGEGPLESYAREAVTLADYRRKYALYRSDPSLRKLHARFPVISVWDDHEVQDNYAGRAPDGGLDSERRYSQARRRAAYRAFFESMPLFPRGGSRIYRAQQHGAAVDLIMLDERQYREDQPCGDRVGAPCPEWDEPRAFLGRGQMGFLKRRLESSDAAWKIVGNQLMMMPAKIGPNNFFQFDPWHGYPQEREELLTHIRDKAVKDVVFITGDIHSFFAGDVKTSMGTGDPVALEFVGGSITSWGLGERDTDLGGGVVLRGNDRNPQTPPAVVQALVGFNPWVDYGDFDHHGFGHVRATPSDLEVTFKRMRTVKSRTIATERDIVYRVPRGTRSIKGQNPAV
jgi:alkaline phosphatase D